MADLSQDELRRLARLGAQARLEQLQREEAAIRAAFPDVLGRGRGRRRGGRRPGRPAAGQGTDGSSRRRGMSAAARKAVSLRMKKYWAERRKAKAAKSK